MSNTVPVITKTPSGEDAGGSALFARYTGQTWLLTAAHVPLGINPAHFEWNKWPKFIRLLPTEGGDELHFPLFEDKENDRIPRFAYLVDGQAIADFIGLPISDSLFEDGEPLAEYVVHDLTARDTGELDEAIDVQGYPTDVSDWPERPNARKQLKVVGGEVGLILHRPEAGGGFSGGALLDNSSRLIGMCMGHNYGEGRAIAANGIRSIIDTF